MKKLLRIITVLICLSPFQAFAMEIPNTSNVLARSYNRVHSLVANHKVAATVLSAATLGAAYYAYKNWSRQNSLSTLDENKEKFYPKDFESLFAKLGVRYLDHLEFEDAQTAQEKTNPENNSLWGESLNQKNQAPVCMQFINDVVGYGVFATENIAKGQFIGEYTGHVHQIKTKSIAIAGNANDTNLMREVRVKNVALFTYAFHYLDMLSVDAKVAGNFTRFVNHSYNPNLDIEIIMHKNTRHVVFIANQPIKKGQQLFIDYGIGYWMGRGIEPTELNSPSLW